MQRNASDGWERWPVRKTLDGRIYLCRWCAKPLSGQCTAYCSHACQGEIETRCVFNLLRYRIYSERGNLCAGCGINLEDLETFFSWYRGFLKKYSDSRFRWPKGPVELTIEWWPEVFEIKRQMGFNNSEHLRECNHIKGISEGGNPVDPDNLEILCLPCHKKHTAALRRRLAAAKKLENKNVR